VEDKSNEITVLPQLLRLVDLAGVIVTIEAMRGHKEIAKTITEQGAAYVLALKDKHPTLPGEGHLFFADVKADRLDHMTAECHTTMEAAHGRLETRHYWLTSEIEGFGVKGAWAHIASVGLVESPREVGGAVTSEQRQSETKAGRMGSRVSLPGINGVSQMRLPWFRSSGATKVARDFLRTSGVR
jgi:predicted transposase YbfD/YdcC